MPPSATLPLLVLSLVLAAPAAVALDAPVSTDAGASCAGGVVFTWHRECSLTFNGGDATALGSCAMVGMYRPSTHCGGVMHAAEGPECSGWIAGTVPPNRTAAGGHCDVGFARVDGTADLPDEKDLHDVRVYFVVPAAGLGCVVFVVETEETPLEAGFECPSP